jgi:tRNA nucleotidyltransferase (CCA-adding enzyme)
MTVPAALVRARFPAPVLEILRRLGEAGHRSWIVGGAVRDLLLHRPRPATDFDVATPARPEEVTRLFRKVIPTGIAHGTVTVLAEGETVEVTTFRGEGAYRDGRRPESVTFLTELEADLARRDFTLNALAFDPLASEFRDPFDGRSDLRRRRVRAVGDPAARFAEDGLRPMRAARFVAQLGFALDPATRRAIPGALPVVGQVSAERITDELSRLVVAPHAVEGLHLLRATGLLGAVLPALGALGPRPLGHAFAVVGGAPAELAPRLGALLHLLAPGQAAATLAALRLPRVVADGALFLAGAFPCTWEARAEGRLPGPSGAEVRRWLAGVEPGGAATVLELASAEAWTARPERRRRAAAEVKKVKARVDEVLARSPPLAVRDLALDGRAVAEALGTAPGPRVGEALRYLLERVLEDPQENSPERLRAALRNWPARAGERI